MAAQPTLDSKIPEKDKQNSRSAEQDPEKKIRESTVFRLKQ